MTRARVRQVVLGVVALAGIAAAAGRVAANAPPGRYTIPGDGTVYDTKTTLTWQQAVPAASYNWNDAKSYCANPGLPGSGWRLPSMKELQTIVDESRSDPAIDPNAFPSTPATFFWTSSPLAGSPSSVWIVYFYNGDTGYHDVSGAERVRCVR